MLKKLLLVLTLLSVTLVSGQENLKGYYIDNAGHQTDGFFMPGDFANTESLKFSHSADGDFVNIIPADIKEYGLDDNLKYQKYTVSVDNSHLAVGIISKNKNPEWVPKTIFVNVILEGDASLYSYFSTNGTIYFYKVDSKNIPLTQLVYKKYMAGESSEAENNHYKQQLFNDVKCDGQRIDDFYGVGYKRPSLSKVFLNFNTCSGRAVQTYSATKNNKLKVNFTVFAGINNSMLSFMGADPQPADNKESNLNLGFGGEVALVLPSRKFSLFLKADYEKVNGEFTHEEQTILRYTKNTYVIDMSLVNVYLGGRYNLYLNTKNHLFIDAAFASGFPSGTYEKKYYSLTQFSETNRQDAKYDLGKDAFWNFGIGYMFNNKYGADIRIDTLRNYFNDLGVQRVLATESTRLALNLRYTIN